MAKANEHSPSSANLDSLLREHFSDLYEYVFFRCHGLVDDAQDICQEVFLILAKKPELAAASSPAAMLRTLAGNVLVDRRRRRAVEARSLPSLQRAWTDKLDAQPLPQETFESADSKALIAEALARLSSRDRMLLRLKYVDGMETRAIAAKFRQTEKSIEHLLDHARKAMKHELRTSASSDSI